METSKMESSFAAKLFLSDACEGPIKHILLGFLEALNDPQRKQYVRSICYLFTCFLVCLFLCFRTYTITKTIVNFDFVFTSCQRLIRWISQDFWWVLMLKTTQWTYFRSIFAVSLKQPRVKSEQHSNLILWNNSKKRNIRNRGKIKASNKKAAQNRLWRRKILSAVWKSF